MAPTTGLLARARAAGRAALDKLLRRSQQQDVLTLPPSPFIDFEYEDAKAELDDVVESQTIDTSGSGHVTPAPGDVNFISPRVQQDPITMNRAFFQGDHWQDGAGWVGPHPESNASGFSDAMREIALAFTSQNVVREVVSRHASGVVGKQWAWAFVPRRDMESDEEPTTEEQTAIKEATAIMRPWLLARKIPKLVRDAVCTVLLAERASVRLFVPAGLTEQSVDGGGIVRAASIAQALGLIWPEHLMPEDAAVITDADTMLECGIWLFEAQPDDSDDDEPVEFAGLTFLDQDGSTIMRLVPADEDIATVESSLQMGGRIPMFEMKRSALVTPQVQQAQRALNLALSMVPRNVITGGFLERVLLNAQMPGRFETDAAGNKTGRFIPDALHVGAGTTNFFVGVEDEGEQGGVTRASPSINWRPPVEPTAAISAADKHYRSILEETGQLHVVMSGDAEASGKSRVEARAEYLTTLQETQPEAEALLRFIIETSLAMAEALANTPGKYTSVLRAQAQCKLDAGPLSADERRAILEQIGKSISQETAMALLGVDDIEAERAKMASDPQARAGLGKTIGEALTALTMAGATLEGAAKLIGLSEDQINDLLTGERFDTQPPTSGADDGDGADAEDNADELDDANNDGGNTGNEPPAKGEKQQQRRPQQRGPARQGSSSGSAAGGE
jgi:hypothetical protein